MKTFDKKDVFTCVNADEAKQYINQAGYFANQLKDFLTEFSAGTIVLTDVQEDEYRPFVSDGHGSALYFLPANKVKEVEEKKYRPFRTTEEFSEVTGKRIGSILKFKCGGLDVLYYTSLYTGFHILENGDIYIELGAGSYSLEQLYNYYEWLDEHGEWQPFGVEE